MTLKVQIMQHCEAVTVQKTSYATLKVTQKPSWICMCSALQPGTRSSLVAFKDPDGSALIPLALF